jgi:hypothetical protein
MDPVGSLFSAATVSASAISTACVGVMIARPFQGWRE